MSRCVWMTVWVVVVAALCVGTGEAQEIPVPEKWDTHCVWFLIANPDYSPGSADDERALTAAHIQYQLQLQESGRSIAAGGLGKGVDSSMIGMTILRTGDRAEAQAIADADPAVRAGRLTGHVREWWIPAGRLP